MASKRTQRRKARQARPTDAITVGRFVVSDAFMVDCKDASATRRFTYYPTLSDAWVTAMERERGMSVRTERDILGNGFIGPTRPTNQRLQARADKNGVCLDGLVLDGYRMTVHLRAGFGPTTFLESRGLKSSPTRILDGKQLDQSMGLKASSPCKGSEDYNENHTNGMLVRTRKSRVLVQRPASGTIVELGSSEEMDAFGMAYDSRAGRMHERIGITGIRHISHERERLKVDKIEKPTTGDGSKARKNALVLDARSTRKGIAKRDTWISDARARYYAGRSSDRLAARNKSLYAAMKARHSSWFVFCPLFGPLF